MELQHFSHEHPLLLINELPKDKQKSVCYGCQESITKPAYYCDRCNYFLHKKCGELPQGVKHPMHPQHPLTLLSHPPHSYTNCRCNVCGKAEWQWFIYHCAECKFDAHVSCTPLEDRPNEHIFHDHPLTFMRRKASFFCDACGTEGEDLSYSCTSTSCEFWIHDTCASSINTIKRNDHYHPLQLAYSIPYSKRKFDHDCYICKKIVHPNYWVYYCPSCTYFAHLKCGTSEEEPLILSDTISVENLDLDLVRVPVPGLMNFMSQFSIDIPFSDDGTRIACASSHYGDFIEDDVDLNNEMKKKEILCDVCVQPIFSSPFRNCGECSFIAHRRCTFLRLQILHPSHLQHPLTLFNPSSTFELYPCKICGGYTNGLFFSCETCNNFQIDVGCATTCLPKTIKHEAHNHPLILKSQVSTDGHHCKACSKVINDYGMKYGCDSITCDYRLHINCAMLPGTLEHDWDKHPISLTYPPFDHPEDYFCETCEEDIHPTHWLYHCSKCDHSFHTNCAHPHDIWAKVKFGITYKFEGHSHNLTSVRKPRKSGPCDHCGKRSGNDIPHLDCASCSYHVAYQCARDGDTKRIEFLGED